MPTRSAKRPVLRAGINPAPTKKNEDDTAVIVLADRASMQTEASEGRYRVRIKLPLSAGELES